MIISDDILILETEQDVKDALKKYDCATYEELEDTLWYTYGVNVMKSKSFNIK